MAKPEVYSHIDVSLADNHYPIIIARNSLSDAALLRKFVDSHQVCIVTNQKVAPLYLKTIEGVFASLQCDTLILPDGEAFKNQESLFSIYDVLIQNKHHRDTTLIALGGGVIGDLVGFAASTYQRGVKVIQIPTTLLAQIDASVGGKTAINHPLAKNMIGSFHQPHMVLVDLNTLNSLPEREFKAGLAEMIKYGSLEGDTLFDNLQGALKNGLNASSPELPRLIELCCKIKASFVINDERELGQRALLNLGHTFGHALESITQYKRWLHGEAVAIGLYCAALLSSQLGVMESKWVDITKSMLIDSGLPYTIPKDIDLTKLMDLMQFDKKIKKNFVE